MTNANAVAAQDLQIIWVVIQGTEVVAAYRDFDAAAHRRNGLVELFPETEIRLEASVLYC